MSNFDFGGATSAITSDDEDNLPYPEALPRSDFLVPDFDASIYLSTLSDRHQSLEDFRSDLSEHLQVVSREMMDLVNTNYEQFLNLGSGLKGGEETIEDVKISIMDLMLEIQNVKRKFVERRVDVEELLKEKKQIARCIALAQKLIEIDSRMEELEDRLLVSSLGSFDDKWGDENWSGNHEYEDEDEGVEELGILTSPKILHRLVLDYRHIECLCSQVTPEHPFIVQQQSRMLRAREVLILDLSTVLKQARSLGDQGKQTLSPILDVYRLLDAGREAVKALNDAKST